jgi:hypothetical protein
METVESKNIQDYVHFLNGKDKYLFNTDDYYTCVPGKVVVYPSIRRILGIFNQSDEGYYEYKIEESGENPRDWIIVKYIVYDRNEMSVYGQVALNSTTAGLKCYKYEYVNDNPNCYMEEFEEIPAKEFKLKSAVRKYMK